MRYVIIFNMRKYKLASKILKAHRKALGFSQEEFSNKIETSRALYSLFEIGERKPELLLLNKINSCFPLKKSNFIRLLVYFDEFPREIENVNELLELNKIDNKTLLDLLFELKENEDEINRAKFFFEAVEHRFDNFSDINCLKANISLTQKDYSRAIEFTNKAIKALDSNSSITLSELEHNLGNIYFAQANFLEQKRSSLLIEKEEAIFTNKVFFKEKDLNDLNKKIVSCYKNADLLFVEALKKEPENEYFIQQKARLYFQLGNIENSKKHIENAINLYNKYITSDNDIGDSRKNYASLFLSLGLAKIGKFEEAERIISIIINYKPDLPLAYYIKSLIYSINGKNYLEKSIFYLKKSIDLDKELIKEAKNDVDLINLRFNKTFHKKFINIINKTEGE
jgi:tetratricopeptide (TPR) repeat protein